MSIKMFEALNVEVTPEMLNELEKEEKEVNERKKQLWLN